MKKIVCVLIIVLVSIPVIWIGYNSLPFEITRRSDIRFGNKLIDRLNAYKVENSRLPADNDWQLLEQLGFKVEAIGVRPAYQKIGESDYELIYLEGFDGPYLLYNSSAKKWCMGFPEIVE